MTCTCIDGSHFLVIDSGEFANVTISENLHVNFPTHQEPYDFAKFSITNYDNKCVPAVFIPSVSPETQRQIAVFPEDAEGTFSNIIPVLYAACLLIWSHFVKLHWAELSGPRHYFHIVI